ncbi:MAG: DUF4248 domain-containing protein [Nostocales cyanobacterium W4_Combined_metabat2_030]|nr:DUF4248 domain-containing protein [Nostocales cyanobacterium W4_Combined_metabat2_030]
MLVQTRKEMANLYKIHHTTLARRLRELGIPANGKRLTPKQVRLIYEELGEPEK